MGVLAKQHKKTCVRQERFSCFAPQPSITSITSHLNVDLLALASSIGKSCLEPEVCGVGGRTWQAGVKKKTTPKGGLSSCGL